MITLRILILYFFHFIYISIGSSLTQNFYAQIIHPHKTSSLWEKKANEPSKVENSTTEWRGRVVMLDDVNKSLSLLKIKSWL
jgi:hypothetical protein